MNRPRLVSLLASLMLGIAGCSGGGDGGSGPPPPPPPPPVTKAEAYQLLNQATFGATEADADRVIAMRQDAWIDDQMSRAPSLQ